MPIALSAATGGTTLADLQAWSDEASRGSAPPRTGRVELLTASLAAVDFAFDLTGLQPTRELDSFPTDGTRRTIELAVGGFTLTP